MKEVHQLINLYRHFEKQAECPDAHFRRVISEVSRVLQRPGFALLTDAGERVGGPSCLGRYKNYFTNPIIGVELLGAGEPEQSRW